MVGKSRIIPTYCCFVFFDCSVFLSSLQIVHKEIGTPLWIHGNNLNTGTIGIVMSLRLSYRNSLQKVSSKTKRLIARIGVVLQHRDNVAEIPNEL